MEAEPGAGANDVFQPSLDLLQTKFQDVLKRKRTFRN
jgi:hypothetical protein